MATLGQEAQPILQSHNFQNEKSSSFMKPWELEEDAPMYSAYKIPQYNDPKTPYLMRNKSELPPVFPKSSQTLNTSPTNKSPTKLSPVKERGKFISKTKRVQKVSSEIFPNNNYYQRSLANFEDREQNPEQSVYDYWKALENANTPEKPKFFGNGKNHPVEVKLIENPLPSNTPSKKSFVHNRMVSMGNMKSQPKQEQNIQELEVEIEEPGSTTGPKKLYVLTKKASAPILINPILPSEEISLEISPLSIGKSPKKRKESKRIDPTSQQSSNSSRVTTQPDANFVPYEVKRHSITKRLSKIDQSQDYGTSNGNSKNKLSRVPSGQIIMLDTTKNDNGRVFFLPNLVANSQLQGLGPTSVETDEDNNIVTNSNTSVILKNKTFDDGNQLFYTTEEEKTEYTEATAPDLLARTEGPEIRKLKTKHLGSEKIIRSRKTNNLNVEHEEVFESRNRLVPHPKGNFAYMYRRAQKKRKAFDKEETQKINRRLPPEDQMTVMKTSGVEPASPKKFVSQYERIMKLKARFEDHTESPAKMRMVNNIGTRNGDAPLLRNIKKQIDLLSKDEGSTLHIKDGTFNGKILPGKLRIKTNEQMFGMGGSRPKDKNSFNLKDILRTANNLSGKKLTPLFSLVSNVFDKS